MNHEQQQQSFSQHSYGQDNSKNYPLIELKHIEGTPFTVVHKDNKHFAVMGDHAITPEQESHEDVEEYINQNMWLVITNVALILIKRHQAFEEMLRKEQEAKKVDPTNTWEQSL